MKVMKVMNFMIDINRILFAIVGFAGIYLQFFTRYSSYEMFFKGFMQLQKGGYFRSGLAKISINSALRIGLIFVAIIHNINFPRTVADFTLEILMNV